MRFKDQVVIISGASSGIGQALALEMAKRGVKGIALLARRAEALETLAADINTLGVQALPLVCDVADNDAVQGAVARCVEELGEIDIVVANAGMGSIVSAFEPDLDAISRIMDINFLGSARLIDAVVPSMVRRRKGYIVGMSSLAGLRGMPRGAGYCASKAALNAYLESYRVELNLIGIPVTTIYPGYVKTPIHEDTDIVPRFVIGVDKAVRIIADGMEAEKAEIRFPLIPKIFMTLLAMAPPWIFDRITRRLAGERLRVPPAALPPGQG